MAARPPPTRPHIALNPSSHFPYSITEWVEDDAWDSTSDSESASNWARPSQQHPAPHPSRPSPSGGGIGATTSSAPKPVPRKSPQNSSSSTLAFSYTHVSAPSPPPGGGPSSSHTDTSSLVLATPHAKNGWTIVQKESADGIVDDRSSSEPHDLATSDRDGVDMTFEDLGEELVDMPLTASAAAKSQLDAACIRQDAAEIMSDPLRLLGRPAGRDGSGETSPERNSRSGSPHYGEPPERLKREQSVKANRRHKFMDCLSCDDVDMAELRKLAWSGIPDDLRPLAWPLLLSYLPLPTRLRASTLERKRGEYQSLVDLTFAKGKDGLDQQIWHQIEIDVPRTRPGVPLWMHSSTQRCLERILYVWAIRHPASGYVQGINDLATPFFQVFLSAYVDADPEDVNPSALPHAVLAAVEADSFWCLSRLLDGIPDNYITAQPGIQRNVKRMAELVARIDAPLSEHLASESVEFMQFAFRWMNCLLMREISVRNTIRMWDTYLSEGPDAFSQFHLYVCSAFLVRWSDKLRAMDFQGIIMFLQSLPTQDWTDHEVEMLLSEAFLLNSIWHNAQSHFVAK